MAKHCAAERPYAIIPFLTAYRISSGTLASRLIYFAVQKKHIALYPAGDAKGLEEYLTERSTLRFPLDNPLPMARIRAFVRSRVKQRESEMKGGSRRVASRPSSSAR